MLHLNFYSNLFPAVWLAANEQDIRLAADGSRVEKMQLFIWSQSDESQKSTNKRREIYKIKARYKRTLDNSQMYFYETNKYLHMPTFVYLF